MPGIRKTLAALVFLPLLAGIAGAKDVGLDFLPLGEIADAPAGFQEMCARDRELCLMGQSPLPVPALRPVTLASGDARPERLLHYAGLAGIGSAATPLNCGTSPRLLAGLGPTGAAAPAPARVVQETEAGNASAAWNCVEPSAAPPLQNAYIPSQQKLPPLSKAQAALIRKVNQQVNRSIVQMSDRAVMGVDEYWYRPGPQKGTAGDCEDIAIEKRARLMELGFPAERLFYAVSYVSGYGLHTVLIARLDDGDYVLDNMTPRVLRWGDVRQVWLRQQIPGQPLLWARISRAG